PFSRPESNHLLTVRGATLQILATCPVVKTFIAGSPFTFALVWNFVPLGMVSRDAEPVYPVFVEARLSLAPSCRLWVQPAFHKHLGRGVDVLDFLGSAVVQLPLSPASTTLIGPPVIRKSVKTRKLGPQRQNRPQTDRRPIFAPT
ncbi:MAG TPA: hypothetical protein VMV69_15505, partial [Pirellulales bacterium]|nr:hypothetical protein [Pirellulales bacterium]